MFSLFLLYFLFLICFFLFGDMLCLLFFFFFFSSRRRHTRWTGDWSSDVCSSDLTPSPRRSPTLMKASCRSTPACVLARTRSVAPRCRLREPGLSRSSSQLRSEERRVGKECRSRWSPDQ